MIGWTSLSTSGGSPWITPPTITNTTNRAPVSGAHQYLLISTSDRSAKRRKVARARTSRKAQAILRGGTGV
jgi:hypothetical protein